MDYPFMVPPFEVIPFKEMDAKQVREYFKWYLSEKENRLKQLLDFIHLDNANIAFDMTPESLIPLWEWFENKIEMQEMSEEDIQKELEGRPEWMREIILSDTKRLTFRTMAIAVDIGFYFAETLIYNNPQIKWGYKLRPRKLNSVKQPVLVGFGNDLHTNPRIAVMICAERSYKEKCKTRLYDAYKISVNNIWVV